MTKETSTPSVLTAKQNLLFGATLFSSFLIILPAMAGRLSNGRTTFNSPPRLVRAATSFVSADSPATYHFTLAIPQNAGESLGAVTVSQRENLDLVSFDLTRTHAFLGDSFAGGSEIPLARTDSQQSDKPGQAAIAFDPPVPPGKTVTVALRAKHNPSEGTYLFGVTAFPAGEERAGKFLGYGRLHFVAK